MTAPRCARPMCRDLAVLHFNGERCQVDGCDCHEFLRIIPETRDWAAESQALMRRERRRLENLLAGRPAGDDGLSDAMDRFIADYDARRAEQETPTPLLDVLYGPRRLQPPQGRGS